MVPAAGQGGGPSSADMPPTDRSRGLSDTEVARRRARWGPNAVSESAVVADAGRNTVGSHTLDA